MLARLRNLSFTSFAISRLSLGMLKLEDSLGEIVERGAGENGIGILGIAKGHGGAGTA